MEGRKNNMSDMLNKIPGQDEDPKNTPVENLEDEREHDPENEREHNSEISDADEV